ncbi:hypothetical protein PENTCL1PPCAC_28888, partial [Pristionchus entomophagus]
LLTIIRIIKLDQDYLAVLRRFDVINLIIIIILGFVTFPLASYVYYKLLTIAPFKNNYTFLLIVVSGVVEFLNYLANLFFIQCTSYSAFNAFYDFLNDSGLSRFAMSSLLALSFLQIMLSLSVAINRLLFICKRTLLQLHARLIFYSSIVISIIIALICAALIHEPHFSYVSAYQGAGAYAHSPSSGQAPSTFLSTALILGVCTSLFLVTLFLAVSVCTYRRKISHGGRHNVESGLIVVAVSNFVNYVLLISA